MFHVKHSTADAVLRMFHVKQFTAAFSPTIIRQKNVSRETFPFVSRRQKLFHVKQFFSSRARQEAEGQKNCFT